jgi:hypothetical protein
MRKDLDEFKKQKLVIGSIVAMPIFLGVVLPLVMFVPMITMAPIEKPWDVDGLLELGSLPDGFREPWTNQTQEYVSFESTMVQHMILRNAKVNDCILVSCVIENSTVSNATIRNCTLTDSYLDNVLVVSSEGSGLDGNHILAVQCNFMFTRTKPSDIDVVLPMMFNMILMIFIIVPATLPTIIASYSIVGEKNNRSLEPLLATPTTDGELLAGKI